MTAFCFGARFLHSCHGGVAFRRSMRHHPAGPDSASAGLPDMRPCGVSKMTVSVGHLSPIVSILAGVLILLMPRLLNYIVAIYLIVIGILGLGILR
jgi:hypothetical protein